jgi:putative flippase GtrA
MTKDKPKNDRKKVIILGILFSLSSFSSFVIDVALFTLANMLLSGTEIASALRLFLATAFGRVISSVYNYLMNKKLVFKSKEKLRSSAVKYFTLAICQGLLSSGLVYAFSYKIFKLDGGILESAVKVVVDTMLFVVSFYVQRKWVFKHQ